MAINDRGLGRRTKLLYGIGDIGFSLTSTIIGVYFLLYLTDVVGLRPALAGLVVLVAKQWDWINDPLIGYLSDRTRSRWGKRRPFLLFGFVPFALAFALMWWKPPFESQTALAIHYGLVYMLYDTAATFVYMPYFALTPALTSDYDERTTLTTYRMAFSIVGSLIAFTVPWIIIGSFRPENADRVLLNGVIFAVASALPLLLTFFGTEERSPVQAESRPSLRHSLRAAVQNRPFLVAVGVYLLTWLTIAIVESTLPYYIKYWLGMEGQSDTIFAAIFVTALATLPLWQWISGRRDKRLAYAYGVAYWAVIQLVLVFLPRYTPAVGLYALGALAGIGVGAAHVLPWSIIPDTVEWGQAQTGQRQEGLLYSLVMLAEKASAGLALGAVGLALDWAGYQANVAIQRDSALLAIRIITGAIPAMLLAGGIALALRFPLGREEHQVLVNRLAQQSTPSQEKPAE